MVAYKKRLHMFVILQKETQHLTTMCAFNLAEYEHEFHICSQSLG